MAITTFVNEAHNSSATLSLTVNVPAGTVDGDTMWLELGGRIWGAVTTTGWTRVVTGANNNIIKCYRTASSEPASYTFTCAADATFDIWLGAICTYRDWGLLGFSPGRSVAPGNRGFYSVGLVLSSYTFAATQKRKPMFVGCQVTVYNVSGIVPNVTLQSVLEQRVNFSAVGAVSTARLICADKLNPNTDGSPNLVALPEGVEHTDWHYGSLSDNVENTIL